ncbi:MAG: AAA family ATPase [Desulfobacteraceae bacterium]
MNLAAFEAKGMLKPGFETIEQVIEGLEAEEYIADRALATVLFLANRLEKPIFLEGEPGVGKTEVAIVMARLFGADLIRLQCYEGLDASSSLYEWNYPKQLLHIRMKEREDIDTEELEKTLYSSKFLIRRPLLEAVLRSDNRAPVLLIDEIDRADEEFEAFLLEVLSDFQITIPEMGTIRAKERPMVVVTSNRTRDVHDALKRRCLYHWIEYPSFDKEYRIITTKLPGIESGFAEQITAFMQHIRTLDLLKRPGVAESLDWARALMAMHVNYLDEDVVSDTLGCVLKYQEDIRKFQEEGLGAAL